MTAHAPFWWAEGGAEYWSEEAGTNVWGTSREAFLRMTVAEDRVLSLDEWTTRIDKEGFTGERGYNHGYAFGRWLKTAVGAEAMAKMAEVSAERWHGSWEAVVEKATGRTLDDLYSAWRAHLDAHYGAQLSTIKEAGVVPGRELALMEPPWEKNDPDWAALSKKERDEQMDGGSAYQEMSSTSPDGQFMAWFDQGLNVRHIEPTSWGAIGGSYVGADDSELQKMSKDDPRRVGKL